MCHFVLKNVTDCCGLEVFVGVSKSQDENPDIFQIFHCYHENSVKRSTCVVNQKLRPNALVAFSDMGLFLRSRLLEFQENNLAGKYFRKQVSRLLQKILKNNPVILQKRITKSLSLKILLEV